MKRFKIAPGDEKAIDKRTMLEKQRMEPSWRLRPT